MPPRIVYDDLRTSAHVGKAGESISKVGALIGRTVPSEN
jgi:hypothetical protein